ncbi:MAG TPA: erythromycin esterase family protein [Chthonomonadaceae bacterium]|nr:erythromycin esterase family protein [Chthonomonadaceae bacterium]
MRTLQERSSAHGVAGVEELAARCRKVALPLEGADDLDPLLKRIGNAGCVLLGEASHGTSEYYLSRAKISQRLIQEKGFSFIAVEGDWPDCYRVNRYIKGYPDSGQDAHEALHAFDRWPTWMWGNWEMVALAEWLRRYNADRPEERKVGFYGLDVYSLWDSLNAVVRYLEKVDGQAAEAAKRAYQCFEPYGEEGQEYARATYAWVPHSCQHEVVEMLTALRREQPGAQQDGREAYFVAEQNALVVQNAEHYYRTMITGNRTSWNVRDRHMAETLERLLQFHGPDAKAIVWEHNTHIGDARATDMAHAGMVNIGQLTRERYGRETVVLVGFGSYQGSVIASYEWGAPMRRMAVPAARPGSWEDVLHQAGAHNQMLLLTDGSLLGDIQRGEFMEPRGHRAIGVVYDPEYEHRGNYVPTILPERYDAFLFLDQTRALHPLHLEPHNQGEPPDTYPWNV